ncbi:MAG: ATP-binding protein [Rectinemataceae bacterium]|jgi:signal transduction histidine kinase
MTLPSFKKISTKVALSYVLIALLQGGLSILTLNYVTNQAMEASLDDQRLKTGRLIENYITDAKKEMVIKADLLAGQGKLANLLARGDLSTLAYELSFYLAPLKLDDILVLDNRGERIVDVGKSSISSILLKRNPVDILDKGLAITIAGEGNRIQLWGLHEMAVNGRRRGILCVAQSLDRSFIGRIEEISGTQMLLALRKTILVNGRLGDNVFIEYSSRVAADPELGASGKIKSFVYRTTYLPEYPELELVYFIDTAPSTALLSRYVTSTLLILAATLIVAFVTSMLLYRYSFQKPFAAFQEAMRRISSGDLNFEFARGTENEFADLEREFEAMTANLSKLERELQISSRMAAVGEMVAGVAHQIRNPLAIMKVSAEMIRDSVPAIAGTESAVSADAETAKREKGYLAVAGIAQKEKAKARAVVATPPSRAKAPEANIRPLIDMIVSEIESLGAIVSKFLDFTKPLKVNPEDVDIEEFLARATSLIPMGQYSGRVLRVVVAAGAEKASFDRRLMEQAVRNLVTNALAATDSGEVLIGAERSKSLEGGQGIFRIFVKDEGPGMSEEVRSQLFHPFFTTKSDGTGLGLSIVHRIVEEHGGSVEVSSELGVGTIFSIILKEE